MSAQVHVQQVARPQEVAAILGSDAGQVFYNREKPGEVIHVDVFHSPGRVHPREVARRILSSLSAIAFDPASPGVPGSMQALLPYIDVQTAAGGGRIDGPLCHGQEQGVRQAHLSHVHVTALAAPEVLSSVFAIVAAVEAAIEDAGLELRRVARVVVVVGTSPVDVSGYSASSDSLLRRMMDAGSGSVFRQEALARQVARDIGSAEETRAILEHLAAGLRTGDFARLKVSTEKTPDEIRQILSRSRLVRYDGREYGLTRDGALALSFLKEHSQEVEAYLRRLLWSLPQRSIPRGDRKGPRTEPCQTRGRGLALPKRDGEQLSDLAVPETVAIRGARPGFLPSDLRFCHSRTRKGTPVILLLDASASMAGRRIRAAKELARHLVHAGREKVSIVTLQDAEVKVVCPFTRNMKKVEAGLREVRAAGLTPLARGLEKAAELASRCLRKPLILCVTDGIPTVPSRSLSPVEDAIAAAATLARRGIRLGCIGLEPNRSFLRQMTSAARGTLYVVEELEAATLAAIARREKALRGATA